MWKTTETVHTDNNKLPWGVYMSQHLNKVFLIWANIVFPLTIESLLLIQTKTQTRWGIYRSHLWAVKCFKPKRNNTQGQDYGSAQHNGLIMGGNVWTRSNAPVSVSVEGNVKVQDTLFTAGSSGNWNVSFFSIALQLSVDLVGMVHAMEYLTLRVLFNGLFMLMEVHILNFVLSIFTVKKHTRYTKVCR